LNNFLQFKSDERETDQDSDHSPTKNNNNKEDPNYQLVQSLKELQTELKNTVIKHSPRGLFEPLFKLFFKPKTLNYYFKNIEFKVDNNKKNETATKNVNNSQISSRSNESIGNITIRNDNNQQFLMPVEDENDENYQSDNDDQIIIIQKLIETCEADRKRVNDLNKEKLKLQRIIDELREKSLEKEEQLKYENDILMVKVHQTLQKESKTEAEREALKKIFLSRQQEINESLIQEQEETIKSLKMNYQKAMTIKEADSNNNLVNEIDLLRVIVHRLNVELSSYQAKYPPKMIQEAAKKEQFLGLAQNSPIPLWLIDTKYLSPLIASYDQKLNEKDEKLKLLKKKIDDVTKKFKMILDENNELQLKLENIPFSKGKLPDMEDFNEL
jgi:hypothetical protein